MIIKTWPFLNIFVSHRQRLIIYPYLVSTTNMEFTINDESNQSNSNKLTSQTKNEIAASSINLRLAYLLDVNVPALILITLNM